LRLPMTELGISNQSQVETALQAAGLIPIQSS